MGRPVGKKFLLSGLIFVVWSDQSAQTYPAFRLCRWPRWRSAHPGPHKSWARNETSSGAFNTTIAGLGHVGVGGPPIVLVQKYPSAQKKGSDCKRPLIPEL